MTLYRRKKMMESYDKAEKEADELANKLQKSKHTVLIGLGIAALIAVLLVL